MLVRARILLDRSEKPDGVATAFPTTEVLACRSHYTRKLPIGGVIGNLRAGPERA
jgi:hypothetical protein